MSKHLTRDLELLERSLLAQASVVEDMIRLATRCLCSQTIADLDELTQLEPYVNEREVRIEEECLKILALHQPVATDLRQVTTVMKINTCVERIGDLGVSIGEHARSLSELDVIPTPWRLEQMAGKAIAMVRDALDAFVASDSNAARQVLQRDNEVDSLNREVIEELKDVMRSNPQQVDPALRLFSAARAIERIADHATNIAEDAIYLVEGEITRHRSQVEPYEPARPQPRPNH